MCYGVMLHIYYISYYIYGVIFDISLYFQHNRKLQKILCFMQLFSYLHLYHILGHWAVGYTFLL